MKRITATEARKNWFRLLDEVARGETVFVERNGKRIVLRAEDSGQDSGDSHPDYSRLLQVAAAEDADRWGWNQPGPERDLEPKTWEDEGES